MGTTAGVFVRDERPSDRAAVRRVNEAAFGQPDEAALVEALHESGAATIALVAERDGEVIGHIVFSPVTVEHVTFRVSPLGLAPMAVSPGCQSQGVGAALVQDGLARCRQLGVPFVVVLGHPSYYPRFGFEPAGRFGLRCEFDAPDEAFMVVELAPGVLSSASGLVSYHEAFRSV